VAVLRESYFVFRCPPEQSTFVFKLTNPQRIQQACDILNGKEKEAVHVTGIIVKSPAPYNPGWTFHYEPDSISFFAFATEVCDATIDYVQEHIDEAGGSFLPGLRWCPWSSQLVSQLRPWPCT
jgi:hypothetical protein